MNPNVRSYELAARPLLHLREMSRVTEVAGIDASGRTPAYVARVREEPDDEDDEDDEEEKDDDEGDDNSDGYSE
jgi:hypothetical protein